MVANRNQRIAKMHAEGATQQAIAEALELDQSTVARALQALMQNCAERKNA
jgi:DNA-binding NarL/FixJ family response regulator